MGTLWLDIRYGLRMLAKHPGFTAVIVLTLALGIGSSTAIFSVVDAVLLRPLPFTDAEQLVWLRVFDPQKNCARQCWSQLFLEWREQARAYTDMATLRGTSFEIGGGEFPESILGHQVSANLFTLIGTEPLLGRTFLPDEGRAGQERVVILGYGLWQRRFGADPNLIGKSVMLNDMPHTVVGIMPSEFRFFDFAKHSELWYAHTPEANLAAVHVIGRLRAQVSRRQAQAEADILSKQFHQHDPEFLGRLTIQVMPLRDLYVEGFAQFLRRDTQRFLLALLGAGGFVLLIAWANITNLLCMRANTRQKEMSIRAALGAPRWRLVRQLLTEITLLALLGAALGLLMIRWWIGSLGMLIPPKLPGPREINMGACMVGFALLLSVVTGIAFGLIPTWQVLRPNLTEGLKEGCQQVASRAGSSLVRTQLVACEVALSFVLLIGATLMIQSVVQLSYVDPGFDPHNLMCVEIRFPSDRYGDSSVKDAAGRANFCQRLTARIRALPGIISSAAAFGLNTGSTSYFVEGEPDSVGLRKIGYNAGSDDYLHAMRIPLLQGWYFSGGAHGEPDTIIVSEDMARRLWPTDSPIGKRIRASGSERWLTVIGVVKDARLFSYDEETNPTFYQPWNEVSSPVPDRIEMVVRTHADPLGMVTAIRRALQGVDKDLPIKKFWQFETRLAENGARRRFCMTLLSVFASVATFLCAIGIYGVTSYAVVQRTREMGLRMALGAHHTDVLTNMLKKGLILILIGLALGVVGALALTRVLRSLLYSVTATDPMTFVVVSLLLIVVGLLACYVPARRVAKIDPMVALRYE